MKNKFLLFIALSLSVLKADIESQIVAHYNFNGNTNDASGNNRHLTNNGATLTEDRFGNTDGAYYFDGADWMDRWFDIGFIPENDDWTVSAFIKPDSLNSGIGTIVSWYRCGATGGCSSGDAAYYEMTSGATDARWFVRSDNDQSVSTLCNIEPEKWQLITGVFSNSQDSVKIYLNGHLISAGTAYMNGLNSGMVSVPLEVGRLYRTGWGSPGNYFKGSIDDIRVYYRALTTDDIIEICSEGGWMISPEVTVSAQDSSVTLSWDAVTGATSYKVYSSTDPYSGFVEVSSGSYNGASWTGPFDGNKLFYYVVAVN
jgi:hypothetical protein